MTMADVEGANPRKRREAGDDGYLKKIRSSNANSKNKVQPCTHQMWELLAGSDIGELTQGAGQQSIVADSSAHVHKSNAGRKKPLIVDVASVDWDAILQRGCEWDHLDSMVQKYDCVVLGIVSIYKYDQTTHGHASSYFGRFRMNKRVVSVSEKVLRRQNGRLEDVHADAQFQRVCRFLCGLFQTKSSQKEIMMMHLDRLLLMMVGSHHAPAESVAPVATAAITKSESSIDDTDAARERGAEIIAATTNRPAVPPIKQITLDTDVGATCFKWIVQNCTVLCIKYSWMNQKNREIFQQSVHDDSDFHPTVQVFKVIDGGEVGLTHFGAIIKHLPTIYRVCYDNPIRFSVHETHFNPFIDALCKQENIESVTLNAFIHRSSWLEVLLRMIRCGHIKHIHYKLNFFICYSQQETEEQRIDSTLALIRAIIENRQVQTMRLEHPRRLNEAIYNTQITPMLMQRRIAATSKILSDGVNDYDTVVMLKFLLLECSLRKRTGESYELLRQAGMLRC
mmetsp:Transcript_3641/g.9650  ORF Transcript_3641/g.9650 Transcript_3641/m.9650 type:complete len:509 (-) Transcript_3641:2337-3863(-)